jgi:hypothetical protein
MSDGEGHVEVMFEVGKARGPAQGQKFPCSDAGVFEDLSRPTLLSTAAEAGTIQILNESALVKAWLAAREGGAGNFGVCIDAPCGFAIPPFDMRETEAQGISSFRTPSAAAFRQELTTWSQTRNHTPLRQRYFWKLVGLVAFRHFAALVTNQPFNMQMPSLTATCMNGHQTRIREGFPSDTYARANGTAGVLAPAARRILTSLAQSVWKAEGNIFNGRTSTPHTDRMKRLLAHRQVLIANLTTPGALLAMQKIEDDPSWADLWDAFTCAFVSCCDFQGCGGFVGLDAARIAVEGAILRPEYL